ncbi:MAG: GFA family protein [Gammaproteobacteria bacterium]|nr:GFA family protein [Gammaproteobacteria bacterium]
MIDGECFCGTIKYKIDGELIKARACHCSRCRKAFSGASSAYAELSDPGSLTWDKGEANLQSYESQEGWGLAFCKTCGTTLCGTYQGKVHGITLGTVNGDPGVEIEAHIFVGSKAPWDHIGGQAPQFKEWQE